MTKTKISSGSAPWPARIQEVLQKYPSVEILTSDKLYKANITSQKNRIIWRCKNHPIYLPDQKNRTVYLSSVDNQPAYNTTVQLFVEKKDKPFCCQYAAELHKKTEAFEILQGLLKSRGLNCAGDAENYQLVEINNPMDLSGKRQQRESKDNWPIIYCKKHNLETRCNTESLQRHRLCPCPECSKERGPAGSGRTREDARLYTSKQKNLSGEQSAFRQEARALGGGKCAITGIYLNDSRNYYIEAHHLNSKKRYPALANVADKNSVLLLKPIHTAYHSKFLEKFDLSYDVSAQGVAFMRKDGNILAFCQFLWQLIRDFSYTDPSKPTLKNVIQSSIDELYSNELKNQQPNLERPLISKENILALIDKICNEDYLNVLLEQPEAQMLPELDRRYCRAFTDDTMPDSCYSNFDWESDS